MEDHVTKIAVIAFAAVPTLALAVLLAGCQTSSPITPSGKDTYMVSSHVAACIRCSARIQSMKVANAFCAKQGKFAIVRNTSGATNPFGYDNGNDMVFSCVSADDPEYARPALRKDNGVTTIEQK
jgi:hypothetical protein